MGAGGESGRIDLITCNPVPDYFQSFASEL